MDTCSQCGEEIVFMARNGRDVWETRANGYIICPYYGRSHKPGKPRTTLAKKTLTRTAHKDTAEKEREP